jgi:hypothetical protein
MKRQFHTRRDTTLRTVILGIRVQTLWMKSLVKYVASWQVLGRHVAYKISTTRIPRVAFPTDGSVHTVGSSRSYLRPSNISHAVCLYLTSF